MFRTFEDQRAAWPSQSKPKNGVQAENESADWETASSSSAYSWSPPPHSAVRVPGLTMTSAGGIRPRYSPPPYMTGRDYSHMDRPGTRERCWTQCAALNARHPRESVIQPLPSSLTETQPGGAQIVLGTRHRRTSSSASRVSRLINSASVRSKRSVSSASSNLTRAASSLAKILSNKGQAIIQRVAGNSKHHVDRPTISRPLSRSSLKNKGINGGVNFLRTDFSAATLLRSNIQDNGISSGDSTLGGDALMQRTKLRRRIGFNNLHDPIEQPQLMASQRASSQGGSDYQEFLTAAIQHGHHRRREISSLVEREDSDNITTIIQRYLGEEAVEGREAGINARPVERAVSSDVQEALKRVTLFETGETVFFI